MTLQTLLYFAKELNLNPVMDEPKSDLDLRVIDDCNHDYDVSNDYRKPFIPYNQELNTHAMRAGAA